MKRTELPFWREPNIWRLIGLGLLMASAFWPLDLHLEIGGAVLKSNVPAILGGAMLGWPMILEIVFRVIKWNGTNS